jgi:alkaline phosphatase D
VPAQFDRQYSRTRLSRRRLLEAAGAVAAMAVAVPSQSKVGHGQPRFAADPFALGVASGDPVADGFVLWTRLAPDPLNGGGMPPEAVPVRWEVAHDVRFLDIARRGETLAAPELGHSVHVDVTGLEPDRWYYYRFIAGGEASPIGRTRTFPRWDHPQTSCGSRSHPASTMAKATSPPMTR